MICDDLNMLAMVFAGSDCETTIVFPDTAVAVYPNAGNDQNPSKKVLVNLHKSFLPDSIGRLEDFSVVLDFGGLKKSFPEFNISRYDYIKRYSGEIRFVYEPGYMRDILRFYHRANYRARIISKVIKLISAVGVSGLFKSGSFTIYHRERTIPELFIEDLKSDRFSCFMGTPGYDRKAVLTFISKEFSTNYLKIALSEYSKKALKNEALAIQRLTAREFKAPKAKVVHGHLLLSNEALTQHEEANDWTPAHTRFLSNMQSLGGESKAWEELTWFSAEKLVDIGGSRNKTVSESAKLAISISELLPKISTAPAHGDFTPWNTKLVKDKLYVIDWEKYHESMPVLFDFFHFHFQKGLLSEGKDLNKIVSELKALFNTKNISALTTSSFTELLAAYLVANVSLMLPGLLRQDELSKNQIKALSSWNTLLYSLVPHLSAETERFAFLKSLQRKLLSTVGYALVKFTHKELTQIPKESDIDMVVHAHTEAELLDFIHAYPNISKVRIRGKSYMKNLEIYFSDGTFLSLDFIQDLKRKKLFYLSGKEILQEAEKNEAGLYIASALSDLKYCVLFYGLNGAHVPSKYLDYFSRRNGESVWLKLSEEFHLQDLHFADIFNDKFRSYQSHLSAQVKAKNRGRVLWDTVVYSVDTLRDIIKNRGFVMTISGVDGAGKSTILKSVAHELESTYRKDLVLLRHRPRALPILSSFKHGSVEKAEKIAGETIPRKGKNKGVLSSILRFAYYYLDYLIGQGYVYAKYVLRGKIVLYDRYYFDFIVDAKRSNVHLNPKIARTLYALIYKPKLNIMLWNDPEVVYQRKQELDKKTISELTDKYRRLFDSLNRKSQNQRYLAIKNEVLDDTIKDILTQFQKVS
jgi:thymidylate kinase